MSRRVVIVGGGAIGSAIAYWLTRESRADLEVVVVERDPAYRRASSALSASSIRQQFSTAVNIDIGSFGIRFLRALPDYLAVEGEVPELGLDEGGYLFLASTGGEPVLRQNHALQRARGADVALLEPAELAARFPWLSTGDVALASLGLSGEGWFDGYGLLRAFRRRAAAQGARFLADEVVGVRRQGARVVAVELGQGDELACDLLVNAAGPWSARVAAMMEASLPVRARRRCVFVLDCPEPLPGCPLMIDPSGFWLRPEGRQFICGAPPLAGQDHDDLPLDEIDHTLFEETIWPTLAHRVPAFERLKVTGSWAGYYEYNTVDQNGLVGQQPGLSNVLVATGFSGHGIQQAPAVGRGIAELVLDGSYRSLDLCDLDPARLEQGRPLLERNVI
ncbi:FAD-binding oxidoreductase [Geminicoccaceae bacterium 1502E]|nr:FAD-binding oxidoreductase [Geminicoccaceae bacterium 1502E]